MVENENAASMRLWFNSWVQTEVFDFSMFSFQIFNCFYHSPQCNPLLLLLLFYECIGVLYRSLMFWCQLNTWVFKRNWIELSRSNFSYIYIYIFFFFFFFFFSYIFSITNKVIIIIYFLWTTSKCFIYNILWWNILKINWRFSYF